MNRKKAKKKAQSRDCSCVLGKDRDNNYNSVIDKVFDDHEKKVKKLSIHLVSKSLQADIRNKLSPLSNLIAMLEDGADDEWLEKQVVECKKSIEYLSNVC